MLLKNKIQKAFLYTCLVLLINSYAGCTDLEPELVHTDTPATFFQTDQDYWSLVGLNYSRLGFLMRHSGVFSLQEVSSDAMAIPQRGNDWGDGHWISIHRHEFKAEEQSSGAVWNSCYQGIIQCNETLARLKDLQQASAGPYIAEVRALRALFYYWLLDMYGNVVLYTEPSELGVPKANVPRMEVYTFILTELQEVLPELSTDVGGLQYGRMNRYSGQALLASLYLNAEIYTGSAAWSEAIDACEVIINSGEYELASEYFDNFNANNGSSQENILVVVYDENWLSGFNLAQMTLHYESQKTYQLAEQPWNGYCALQEFYQTFDTADVRKDNFLVGPQYAADGSRLIDPSSEPDDPDGPPVTFTPEINELRPNCFRQAGARVGKFEFELGAKSDLNNDAPIFRYAEILLNKAEALWRQNPGSAEALALVNQVRQRAGVSSFPELTADNLLAERGRELAFEAKRRTDLIRFDRFGDAWEFKPTSEPCKTLFPIPQSAFDNGNPLLVQNPCY